MANGDIALLSVFPDSLARFTSNRRIGERSVARCAAAMIPYVEQPSVRIGPLTIHAFGVIIAAAVLIGLEIGRRRIQRFGLDPKVGEGFAWYVIVGGFLGAHLFSVLFYFPAEVAQSPLVLFKLWEDISSFGGILGGLVAAWLYFRIKAQQIDRATRWIYVDVAAFVFPISLAIGRIACSLAHDHPGTLTGLPLAVSLKTERAREYITGIFRGAGRLTELPAAPVFARLGFHDLGWYEFLYLSVVVVPLMFLVDGRRHSTRPAGALLALFILLYMPVRFALDFLRVSDVRYAGLTPAQWVAGTMLVSLPVVWLNRRQAPARLETRQFDSAAKTEDRQ